MNPYKAKRVKSSKDPVEVVETEVVAEPVDPETVAEPVEEDVVVPDGTAKEVLAWVGDDHTRAEMALKTEKGRETPRKGVISALEELLG